MTKVFMIESERGWGSRVDEVKEFDTPEQAEAFVIDYNTKYNPPSDAVPDWFMYAEIEGYKGLGMQRE